MFTFVTEFFSGARRLERMVASHLKLADKARKVVAKLEAEEEVASEEVTAAIAKVNAVVNAKARASKFLEKVEEFV